MATEQPKAEPAFDQVVEWLGRFEDLGAPRRAGKVCCPLDKTLPLCLLAVLAGTGSWVEIAEFGRHKIELLRRFTPFAEGTPSRDCRGELVVSIPRQSRGL